MEIGEDLNLVEKKGDYHPNDTVIQIAADTEDAPISKEISESQSGRIDTVITEKEDLSRRKPVLVATGSPDNPLAETAGGQGQALTRGNLVPRFEKPHVSVDAKLVEGNTKLTNSPPRIPRLVNPGHNEEKKKQKEKTHKKGGKVKKILTVIELIAFVSVMGLLIASL